LAAEEGDQEQADDSGLLDDVHVDSRTAIDRFLLLHFGHDTPGRGSSFICKDRTNVLARQIHVA